MKLLKHVTKIRVRISRGLATQHPVKLLGVLALGAIVMAGTGLYFAPNSANEMSTHPLNEDLRIVPDDEWMYGQQNYEAALAANLARREDEAKATMRRVEAYVAANKSYEAARAANLARREDEAKATMRRVEAYIAANKANEIAENFSRIREEGRAADRQDDLQDMVRYWNQLERDAEVDATVKSNDMDALSIVPVNESSGETLRMRDRQRQADRQEDFQFMLRYWNQLERGAEVDTTVKSHDVDAFSVVPANESSGETFRIQEEQRATDRADDLTDMIQYWNQLQQSAANGTLWVTNRPLNNVTVFDSGTGDVLGTIPVGDVPIGVTAPPGTGKVYVSNDTPDTVSVIDKSSLSVVETIPMGDRPHHMTHSPNGKFVYVAEFGANTVGVINTDSDTIVAHYTAGTAVARTHAVWVTRDGKTLYVTNSIEDTIAALDAQTGALLWSLPVGTNPSEILVTPDGKTGYVTVRGEDKVKVVDLTVAEIVGEVVVGVEPDTLQLTPDLKTLVVALRGTPARVALVDTRTLAVTPVTITPGATTGHQWLSANGNYTFVAVEDPGSVAVILNSTATVVAIYPYPGGGRPHGVFHEAPQLK